MTVSTTPTGVVYEVSSSAAGAEYPIDFPYLHERDVHAYYALGREETGLISGTDFEVNGGALITLREYPIGAKLAIYRKTPHNQEILWVDGQAVYPPAIMEGDDKLTMIVQELAGDLERAVKVPRDDAQTTPEDLVEDLFAARDQTAASAGAASAAAGSASASASSALEQADRAEYQADRAQTQADRAAASEELARQWAEHPEDTPVIAERYSAYHWAQKALENAASGLRLSDALDGTRTAVDGVSASEWALAQVNEKAVEAQTAAVLAQTTADAALARPDNAVFVGEIRLLSLSPSELAAYAPGWYFCNGDQYGVGTKQGKALLGLSTTFKNNWGIVDTGSVINLPNLFYTDGRGYFLRASTTPGDIKDDSMRPITGTISNGGGFAIPPMASVSGALYSGYAGNWLGGTSGGSGTGAIYINSGRLGDRYNGSETAPIRRGMTPAIFLGV